jgi:plastocyanin
MDLRMGTLVLVGLFGAAGVLAAEPDPPPTVVLTLKDHRFIPDQVSVPAGRTVRIELINQDAATEEFDSDDLRVERDVTPHDRTSFTVGPLKPGSYSFMGELHADTASGTLTAVERQRP